MVRLPLLAAALSVLLAAPALAAPLIITVPGQAPVLPPLFEKKYHVPPTVWQNPTGRFSPGDAALDAVFHTPWAHYDGRVPEMSDETMTTLIVTGDSIGAHMLKCQAAHASYSIVDD